MDLKLLSCDQKRPNKRDIAHCLSDIAIDLSESLASELTEILLEGDEVDIVVDDKNSSSAFRALRKLEIDYEIVE